jgi:hypothetical protein
MLASGLPGAGLRASAPARGEPLSSAILYLAIVAIWAGVLVPRWLRRSHEHTVESQDVSGLDETSQAEFAEPGTVAGGEMMADGEMVAGGEMGTGDAGSPREREAVTYADPVAWEEPAGWADTAAEPPMPEDPAGVTYSVTASYSEEITYCETDGSADVVGPGGPGGPAAGYWRADGPARPPGPSPRVLQARRRTLSLLITITVAAMGSAFVGLTPWWTAVAPFLMLGAYLMLLREAAHADAEHALRWAGAQARAAQAAQAAELERQRASYAPVAAPPPSDAEIIRITPRAAPAADEPYDQYTDAEIRAVGD